ncbi:ATP-binding protein [Nocardioidaceae bacterium SCSIO 66511]|nr:ATP-binding protein [Nocardioidaceae bacterium SCSIO 66511]
MPRVELRLQPDPALLRVMRMTIGSTARLRDLSEPLVDDIRLAVTEAASEAIAAHTYAQIDDPVAVVLDIGEDEVVVTVEHHGVHGRVPATATQSVDRLAVASGMADDLRVREGADTTCVELRWKTDQG